MVCGKRGVHFHKAIPFDILVPQAFSPLACQLYHLLRGPLLFCRQESVRYQKNLKAYSPAFKKIKPLRQVATFAVTIVEKIDCWTNPIPFENIRFSDDDAQALIEQLNQGKGAFIVISHLGDSEVLRSLANKNEIGIKRTIPIAVLSDRDVSSNFSKAMTQINKHFYLNTINVNDITPATIEQIMDTINQGGLVVCAGDRLSKNKSIFMTL